MSSSLITNSLRLLRISSHVKWQAPVVAAVRHYGKWAASPAARRDFITGIDTHTHIDTFVCFAASQPKRFYKQTNVLSTDTGYEVTLDHRKLKTPNGTVFTVKSEPLAIAVATEFDSQKEHIERSRMHISALCFTALDNPNKLTKPDIVNYLLNFVATDTVLFQYDVSWERNRMSWNTLTNARFLYRMRKICRTCSTMNGIRLSIGSTSVSKRIYRRLSI